MASGRLAEPAAAADLRRAVELAGQAAVARPRDPEVQRAFGLALSASGRLAEAARIYDRALADHPEDWGLLINRADLLDIEGRTGEALSMLERAYEGMDRAYAAEPARVRPWQAEVGVEIGRRYEARSDPARARAWYRRTIVDAPSASAAAERLAALPPEPA
jgi:tetratricopeptide (TPR) repeat protein